MAALRADFAGRRVTSHDPDYDEALIPYTTATYHNWTSRHIEPRPYRHYGEYLPRLIEIKRKYDPENVFVVGGGLPLSISEPDAKEWGLSPRIVEGLRTNGSLTTG